MPYLKLNTNLSISKDISAELLLMFSQLLAKETGKSENFMMVELEGDKQMIFSANNDALAYLECKSIGLSANQAKSLAESISQILESKLQISANRVYIEFSNCPAEFWGWNGSTFG